jgi:hypothetical protein
MDTMDGMDKNGLLNGQGTMDRDYVAPSGLIPTSPIRPIRPICCPCKVRAKSVLVVDASPPRAFSCFFVVKKCFI